MFLNSLFEYTSRIIAKVVPLQPQNQMARIVPGASEMDQTERLQDELRNKEKENRTIKKEIRGWKDECRKEKDNNDELRITVSRLDLERVDAWKAADYWKRALELAEIEHKKMTIKRDREFKVLQKDYDAQAELSATRSAELKAAQVFLSKADSISEVEAIQLVKDLNAQIIQTAASLTDEFETTLGQQFPVKEEAVYQVEKIYGRPLLLSLRENDPEILQVAFQAAMLYFVGAIVMQWDWCSNTEDLPRIYADIHGSEEQSVAGRWRSLTRKHVQNVPADLNLRLKALLMEQLVPIIGCYGVSGDHNRIFDRVEKSCQKRIAAIVAASIRLNKALGCEITSADLKLFTGTSAMKFDQQAMEEEFVVSGESLHGRVIAGTEFGVLRTVKLSAEKGAEAIEVLLKAKVFLDSSINVFEENRGASD